MVYAEFAPSESLRPLVRCYWSLTSNDDASAPSIAPVGPEPALPDGSPELIVNAADPFHAVAASGEIVEQSRAILVGQITKPFAVAPTGRVDLFAVRFRPHGATLVSDDLGLITDSWIDVHRLPVHGLDLLADALSAQRDVKHRCAIVDRVLGQLLVTRRSPDRSVHTAVQAIEASHGTVVLDELAATIGCSLRHLQRQFARQVGITPKLLSRIRRFQRVFAAWRDDPRSLARVAAECGYFDQPHLVRDFHDFAGQAPAAFLANQPEFTQFFLPAPRPPHRSPPESTGSSR